MIEDLVSDHCMEIPSNINQKYSQRFTALSCDKDSMSET